MKSSTPMRQPRTRDLINLRPYRSALRVIAEVGRGGSPASLSQLEAAARHLAGCLCLDPMYSEIADKAGWIEARLHSLLERAMAWTREETRAIRRGLACPVSQESRPPYQTDQETLLADLSFVLGLLGTGTMRRKARRWQARSILVGMSLVLESRRWKGCEFFACETDLAGLVDLQDDSITRPIQGWTPSLVSVTDSGNRFRARSYSPSIALDEHLSLHPTPREGKLLIGTRGASFLLRDSAKNSPILAVDGWKQVQLILEQDLCLTRSDGSRRRRFRIPALERQPKSELIQRRPVSWSTCPTVSGRHVIDEIIEARPYRTLLAEMGIPIDIHATKRNMQKEEDAVLVANQTLPKELHPLLLGTQRQDDGRRIARDDDLLDLRTHVEGQTTVPPMSKNRFPRWLRGQLARDLFDHSLEQELRVLIAGRAARQRQRLLAQILDRLHPDGKSRSSYYDGSSRTNRFVSFGCKGHGTICHQTIPHDLLTEIMIIPKGMTVLSADFKSFDFFSLAELSLDPQLINDLQNDIYTTCGKLFGPQDLDPAKRRQLWKATLLAWLYGGGPEIIEDGFGFDSDAARHIFGELQSRYSLAAGTLTDFEEHHRRTGRTAPSICGFTRAGGRPETLGRNTPVAATSADIARRFEIEVLSSAAELGVGLDPILSIYDGFAWCIGQQDIGTAPRILLGALRRTEQKLALSIPLRLAYGTGNQLLSPSLPLLASMPGTTATREATVVGWPNA